MGQFCASDGLSEHKHMASQSLSSSSFSHSLLQHFSFFPLSTKVLLQWLRVESSEEKNPPLSPHNSSSISLLSLKDPGLTG
jgi:hypothetical protein